MHHPYVEMHLLTYCAGTIGFRPLHGQK